MTRRLALLLVLLACGLGGCAFHTTALAWNGRLGADGTPVFYTATTKVGLKLFVGIPLLGNTDVDGMVADLTAHVAERGGDHVRIVTGDSENYWYGFPPLTWILTPVISRVHADWRPSLQDLAQHIEDWGRTAGDGARSPQQE